MDKQDGYGRANKAAAWLLLARDDINAKVYSGTEHNDSAKYFADRKLLTLHMTCVRHLLAVTHGFQKLFMADNDVNGAENEDHSSCNPRWLGYSDMGVVCLFLDSFYY